MLRHADREYETELGTLREQLLLMAAKVEQALEQAMTAFERGQPELARQVIVDDGQIDRLEKDIDGMALRILARRQPVASDLRFVATTLKVVTDLERIGDLGVNIAERVVELGSCPKPIDRHSIPRIAEAALGMLHDALDSYVAADADKAEQVIVRDSTVDAYYAQLFHELVAEMAANPETTEWVTRLQSIGKYLERVADHATNLAEMVVFMVKGEDVRHTGKTDPQP
jgi:phosphate transport system protein